MPTITIVNSRTLDVPEYGKPMHPDELRDLVTRSGSHFFDRDTMRWFKSRLEDVYAGPDGWYFVTSEKHEGPSIGGRRINEPRLYTVRRLSIAPEGDDLRMYEYEGFQWFPTLGRARTVARRLAKTGAVVCGDCRVRVFEVGKHGNHVRCQECQDRHDKRVREISA